MNVPAMKKGVRISSTLAENGMTDVTSSASLQLNCARTGGRKLTGIQNFG